MDTGKIIEEIRENHKKQDSCDLHQFEVPKAGCRLGQYYTCKNCGWKTRIVEIGLYALGYKAGGGNPNDVMEGIL